MNRTHSQKGSFEKVGECLYRYSSNGAYYAVVRHQRKLIRRSLHTTDRAVAKRKLADFRREVARLDTSQGRLSLKQLCDRYLATIRDQAPRTIRRKKDIVTRIIKDWSGGSEVQVTKVRASDVSTWLASYNFGWASHQLHLECVRAVFDLAIADKIIVESPARSASIQRKKKVKPIRLTPSIQEFQMIVDDLRQQKFHDDAQETADFIEYQGLAGQGQAEASCLRWSDIDWKAGRIATYRHKTKTRYFIPIYPQIRPLLERRQKAEARSKSILVFRIKDAKKGLAAACRRLQLPAYSQRSLRRMFVTTAIQRGVDIKTISEWQGHQDGGKLILDTYSHLFATHSMKMAELMTPNHTAPSNAKRTKKRGS